MGAVISPEGVTELLHCLREGDKGAEQRLMSLLYAELHALAARSMRREYRAEHTLQPTALVNEVYLRLVAPGRMQWNDRLHFMACAAVVMKHVLADHAKHRRAAKRGGGVRPVNADLTVIVSEDRLDEVLELDRALNELQAAEPEVSRVVTYRLFGGLTNEEIAGLMDISTRTVKRYWSYGRAWLKVRLKVSNSDADQ